MTGLGRVCQYLLEDMENLLRAMNLKEMSVS